MSKAIIVKGREKSILRQHPWIFSGAIERMEGNPSPGDIVTVVAHDGKFLARGYWNPKSQIQVRVLTWHDEEITHEWWLKMLKRALAARFVDQRKARGEVNAFRLVHAESDFLPGLIIDLYGEYAVLQALTLGIEHHKQKIAEVLPFAFPEGYDDGTFIKGVYERSDVDVRGKEGLKARTGLLWGEEPPENIEIQEQQVRFLVDVRKGHKTGFYLDQRENRHDLLNFISNDFTPEGENGHRVLNLFSYTGGFGVSALWGGQGLPGQIVNVDSSQDALHLAEANFRLNFVGKQYQYDYKAHVQFIAADAFEYLRNAVTQNEKFDIVILDPPKFAQNQQQVDKAARGYKDINLNAFKIIKSGGYLMTFSCSGAISQDLFQKIVFGALADSGRQGQIIKHLNAADDHPIALTFPEGEYLKGLLVRVY